MIFLFKWISSNSTVTNLFLTLQTISGHLNNGGLLLLQTTANHSVNQNAGTTKILPPSGEGCSSNENTGFPDIINITCNRSNQNVGFPDTQPLNQSASGISKHNKNHVLPKHDTMLTSITCSYFELVLKIHLI